MAFIIADAMLKRECDGIGVGERPRNIRDASPRPAASAGIEFAVVRSVVSLVAGKNGVEGERDGC